MGWGNEKSGGDRGQGKLRVLMKKKVLGERGRRKKKHTRKMSL